MLRSRNAHLALLSALFASGAAALIYQATWGRMLQRVFGVSDLAIATVLGSFFAGLGIGSALGGRVANRVRRPERAYAALELFIGGFAVLSLALIPRVHDVYAAIGSGASFGALTVLRLSLALFVLLPPTIAMGATLPVLIAAVRRGGGDWTSRATLYYATNTAGAVFGAGASGLFLVPTFGARAAILVAAAASGLAALIVFAAARTDTTASAEAAPDSPTSEAATPTSRFVVVAMALAGTAGVASLAGEVLWTRVLRIAVQGTTQAFAAMLVNYLTGIAIGSYVAERLARRARSPLRAFAWSQVLVVVLGAYAFFVAAQLPRLIGIVRGSIELIPHEPHVLLIVSAALLLPLAMGIGAAIPLAWRVAGGTPEEAARHAGSVLAANTLGGLVGSMLAGFVLVPVLGVDASILVVLFLHALTGTIAFAAEPNEGPRSSRIVRLLLPMTLLAALVARQPSVDLAYLVRGHFAGGKAVVDGPGPEWRRDVVFMEEGRNTTVTVTRAPEGLFLLNDGRPESGWELGTVGFGPELGLLGALPGLYVPERGRAMVIGLGAGHTASVMLSAPWRRVDVIELEDSVVRAARFLYAARERPFPLDDPRAHLIVDDARAQLALAPPNAYDAIVSQPSHPWLAGSSALYTREFFEEAKRALKPGGVLTIWLNMFRMDVAHARSVLATLRHVFPHVTALEAGRVNLLMSASTAPLVLGDTAQQRWTAEPTRGRFLAPNGISRLADVVALTELDEEGARAFVAGAPLVEDDRPMLEFGLARLPHVAQLRLADLDRHTARLPWLTAAALARVPPLVRTDAFVSRIDAMRARPLALGRIERSIPLANFDARSRGLVDGALAEARGLLTQALTHYRAAGTPAALARAEALLLLRGDYAGMVDLARSAPPRDRSPLPAMRALAALGSSELNAELAPALRPTTPPTDASVAAFLAWLDGGCAAWLATPAVSADRVASIEFAALGERCAREASRAELAEAYRLAKRRLELARLADLRQRLSSLVNGENWGAAVALAKRGYELDPFDVGIATTFARVLHRGGRADKATEVLRAVRERTDTAPDDRRVVEQVAAELRLSLDSR